jgi:uncharacterized protein YecT (DUF1311 family)
MPVRHCFAAIATAAALLPAPLAAQSTGCDQRSQPEINACELRLFAAADAELNLVYRRLRARMDGKELAALVAAQRSWLAYRDRECDFETIGEAGGSIRPMELSICSTTMTRARTAELQRMLQ